MVLILNMRISAEVCPWGMTTRTNRSQVSPWLGRLAQREQVPAA